MLHLDGVSSGSWNFCPPKIHTQCHATTRRCAGCRYYRFCLRIRRFGHSRFSLAIRPAITSCDHDTARVEILTRYRRANIQLVDELLIAVVHTAYRITTSLLHNPHTTAVIRVNHTFVANTREPSSSISGQPILGRSDRRVCLEVTCPTNHITARVVQKSSLLRPARSRSINARQATITRIVRVFPPKPVCKQAINVAIRVVAESPVAVVTTVLLLETPVDLR